MNIIIDKGSVVADTIHGQIAISSFEKDVIATTLFNRLHGIHQNSTAYMTFPTNRTKRVEHSFGTMYLCGNIFSNSICNASPEDNQIFFDTAKKKISEVISLIKGSEKFNSKLGKLLQKVSVHYEKFNINGGIYDQVIPGSLERENQKVFVILFEAIRISALLHDVGHPPFSHITEFALKNVYKRVQVEGLENETVVKFKDIMQAYCENDAELHEQMGNSIAKTLLTDAIDEITEDQAKEDAIYDRQIFRLIVSEMVLNILEEKDYFYKDLHSIISGTLDGDRLDYVSRDAINSGFSVGIIEYDRLISGMKLVSTIVENKQRFSFCPCTSVVNTIEDFLLRRWNLYCNIIYHHHVVKTDYLLQKSIEEIAYTYLKNDEDELEKNMVTNYPCQPTSYHYTLPYNISGLWKAVQRQPSPLEWGYAINQWDDAWLLTVLKKVYFEKIMEETSCLEKMLTELLTNKRKFTSLVKRKEEFGVIDKAVAQEIVKRKSEIQEAVRQLRSKKSTVKSKVNIDGFLKNINLLLSKSAQYSQKGNLKDNDGFLLVFVHTLLSFEPKCDDKLQDIVSNVMEKQYGDACFVVFKTPKTGTRKVLHIYKKYYETSDEKLVKLDEISDISKILENNLNFTPFFFIYMDIEKTSHKDFDFKAERKRIGTYIADGICDYIVGYINNIL